MCAGWVWRLKGCISTEGIRVGICLPRGRETTFDQRWIPLPHGGRWGITLIGRNAKPLSPALAPPPWLKPHKQLKPPIPTELEQTCGKCAVPRQSGAKGPSMSQGPTSTAAWESRIKCLTIATVHDFIIMASPHKSKLSTRSCTNMSGEISEDSYPLAIYPSNCMKTGYNYV